MTRTPLLLGTLVLVTLCALLSSPALIAEAAPQASAAPSVHTPTYATAARPAPRRAQAVPRPLRPAPHPLAPTPRVDATGPKTCLAQPTPPVTTGVPNPDPCQVGAEMGRMQPCLKAEDCGAYQTWELMLGAPGDRLAPLEPGTVSTGVLATEAAPATPAKPAERQDDDEQP